MKPSEQTALTIPTPQAIEKQANELADTLSQLDDNSASASDSSFAQGCHDRLVAATRVGKRVGKAANLIIRREAIRLYLGEGDRGFRGVKMPYPGNPSQTMSFDDYYTYLRTVAESEEIDPSSLSGLYNFVINVVDPVSKGLIAAPETREPYNVGDLMDMREKQLQMLASAANTLRRIEEKSDDEKHDMLGELIFVANDPESGTDDLETAIYERGLKNRRNELFDVKIARVGEQTVFMAVLGPKQATQMTIALERRSNIISTTFNELMSDLNDAVGPMYTIMVSDDTGFGGFDKSEPSEEDYSNFVDKFK